MPSGSGSTNKIISIHAPRVGRDAYGSYGVHSLSVISIHAPRVGRDITHSKQFCLFLNFNPRAPCGARPQQIICGYVKVLYFNPRAPCGARLYPAEQKGRGWKFQSTRPVWGATTIDFLGEFSTVISIHAPRVGRDQKRFIFQRIRPISIHAPRVGRDVGS